MSHKSSLLIKHLLMSIGLVLLFAQPVKAVDFVASPEVCGDGIDNDGNGAIDDGCPIGDAFTIDDEGGFRAHIKNCQKTGYTNESDGAFPSATKVQKPAGTAYFSGEIGCKGTFPAGTYFVYLFYLSTSSPRVAWIRADASHSYLLDNANDAFWLPSHVTTPSWELIGQVGSLANFVSIENGVAARSFSLNGTHTFFIKSEADVVPVCMYVRTSSTAVADADCPIDAPATVNYEVLKLSGAAPTSCADAQFTNADAWTWIGTNTNLPPEALPTAKMIHSSTNLYGCLEFTDGEIVATTTTDDTQMFNPQQDRIELAFRNDNSTGVKDSNYYKIVINARSDGGIYTANYPAGVETVSGWNPTVSRTVDFPSGKWRLFFDLTMPFSLTDGLVIRANVFQKDKDTATSTSRFTCGNSVNDPTQLCQIRMSATQVPSPPDTTPPVVTVPAVPSATIEITSAVMTATTDEAGTCRAHYGTATGSYTKQTAGSASVSGACTETMGTGGAGSPTDPPLTAGTTYFAEMRVTDAAGNVGDSTEVSFTTDAPAGSECITGTWTIQSRPPANCIPYPNGLFQKKLPNAGSGGPTNNLATNSAQIVTTSVTRETGSLSESQWGAFTVATPGTNAWNANPMYYGRTSDPIYKVVLCTNPSDLSDVDPNGTTWHIPNQAFFSAAGDGFFRVWDQTSNRVLSLYHFGTPKPVLPNCTATDPANACAMPTLKRCSISDYSAHKGYLGGGAGDTLYSAADALTVRADEWIAGTINHALYINVRCEDTPTVFPSRFHAATCDGSGATEDTFPANHAPHGGLFFLDYTDAQITAMGLPAWQTTILKALAHYGGYVGDTGGNQFTTVARHEGGEAYEHAGTVNPLFAWLESQGVNCVGPSPGNTSQCRYNLKPLANIPLLTGPFCSTACNVLGHMHLADQCVPKALAGVAGGCP